MSSFAGSAAEQSVEQGKEEVAARLEAAVRAKAEENLALYQDLLRKQALLEEAAAVFGEAEDLLEKKEEAEKQHQKEQEQKKEPAAAVAPASGPAPVVEEAEAEAEAVRIGEKLAPYNPTNLDACRLALDMLKLQDSDILYDLGCGDARMLVEAWNRFRGTGSTAAASANSNSAFRATGVEYDSLLCTRARDNLSENGISVEQATIIHDNVLNVNFAQDATALFIYLVPQGMTAIKDAVVSAIRDRGIRVVTYVFSLPGLQPKEVQLYKKSTKLYYYDHTCLPAEAAAA